MLGAHSARVHLVQEPKPVSGMYRVCIWRGVCLPPPVQRPKRCFVHCVGTCCASLAFFALLRVAPSQVSAVLLDPPGLLQPFAVVCIPIRSHCDRQLFGQRSLSSLHLPEGHPSSSAGAVLSALPTPPGATLGGGLTVARNYIISVRQPFLAVEIGSERPPLQRSPSRMHTPTINQFNEACPLSLILEACGFSTTGAHYAGDSETLRGIN